MNIWCPNDFLNWNIVEVIMFVSNLDENLVQMIEEATSIGKLNMLYCGTLTYPWSMHMECPVDFDHITYYRQLPIVKYQYTLSTLITYFHCKSILVCKWVSEIYSLSLVSAFSICINIHFELFYLFYIFIQISFIFLF